MSSRPIWIPAAIFTVVALFGGLGVASADSAHASPDTSELISIDTHGAAAPGETAYLTTHPGAEVQAVFTLTAEAPAVLALSRPSTKDSWSITNASTCRPSGKTTLRAGESCEVVIRYALDSFPSYNVTFASLHYRATAADDAGNALPEAVEQSWSQPLALYPNAFSMSMPDFGEVEIGASATRTLRVTNSYAPDSRGSDLRIGAGPFVGAPYSFASIGPGESFEVPVTFTPTHLDEVRRAATPGYVPMNTGKLLVDPYAVLRGTGTAPAIALAAPSIDFGDVVANETKSRPLAITNTGDTSTTVSVSNRSELAEAGVLLDFLDGTELGAGETLNSTASWTPAASGLEVAPTIDLTYTPFTDPAGVTGPMTPLSVPLTGRSIAPDASVIVTPVDFGKVMLGAQGNKEIRFTNPTDHDITVAADAATFSKHGLAMAETTVAVPAHGDATTRITWRPTKAGTLHDSISFVEQETGAPVVATVQGTTFAAVTKSPNAQLPSSPPTTAGSLPTTGSSLPTTAVGIAACLSIAGVALYCLTRRRARGDL